MVFVNKKNKNTNNIDRIACGSPKQSIPVVIVGKIPRKKFTTDANRYASNN